MNPKFWTEIRNLSGRIKGCYNVENWTGYQKAKNETRKVVRHNLVRGDF